MESHVLSGCHYRAYPCPHIGCKAFLSLHEVVGHLTKEHGATWNDATAGTGEVTASFPLHESAHQRSYAPQLAHWRGNTLVCKFSKADGIDYAWAVVVGETLTLQELNSHLP